MQSVTTTTTTRTVVMTANKQVTLSVCLSFSVLLYVYLSVLDGGFFLAVNLLNLSSITVLFNEDTGKPSVLVREFNLIACPLA